MTHIMVDIETLGNGPKAIIAQIGAVAFRLGEVVDTPNSFDRSEKFYRTIDVDQPGRKFDADTFYFWMMQLPEARNSVFPVEKENRVSLAAALVDYHDWVRGIKPEKIWCNGATFDHVILSDAFKDLHKLMPTVKNPTHFRDMWDQRTAIGWVKLLGFDIPRPEFDYVIMHNAMHDAAVQAIWVQRVFIAMKNHLG